MVQVSGRLAAHVLRALGVDPAAGGYVFDNSRLYVEGFTDADVMAAVSALDMAAILAEEKRAAVGVLNSAAENARAAYLPSVGQALTYQEKEAQARAYQAAGFAGQVPELVRFDVVAGIAADAQAAALAIIAAADAARAALARIEGARRAGIAAINAAQDAAGIEAALSAAVASV